MNSLRNCSFQSNLFNSYEFVEFKKITKMIKKFSSRETTNHISACYLFVSFRYKLIRYQDADAIAELKIGDNHFLKWTVPIVACGFLFILIVLICAQNDSIICRICSAKQRNGYIKEEDEA